MLRSGRPYYEFDGVINFAADRGCGRDTLFEGPFDVLSCPFLEFPDDLFHGQGEVNVSRIRRFPREAAVGNRVGCKHLQLARSPLLPNMPH